MSCIEPDIDFSDKNIRRTAEILSMENLIDTRLVLPKSTNAEYKRFGV